MTFTLELPIETQRLRVRRFVEADRAAFLDFMLDPDCTRLLMFPDELKTESGANGLLDHVIAAYDSAEPVHSYAIALEADDTYVGSCGCADYPEGGCEIYYALNPEYVGQGYATEATAALVAQIPAEVTVRAFCHPENLRAHQVAERLKLSPRGLQRHAGFGSQALLFVRD